MSDEKVNQLQKKIWKKIHEKRQQIVKWIKPKEHAKIVRKELKKEFPNIKFSVRSAYFAGGSSVYVHHIGEITDEMRDKIKVFVNKFDGFEGDLMDGRYNVGFIYEGERISGASFCIYNGRKW